MIGCMKCKQMGRRGYKIPNILWTSSMEGPFPCKSRGRWRNSCMFAKQADDVQDFCCSFSPSISRKMNAAMAVGRLGPRLWCRRRLGAELCTVLCKRLSEIRSYSRNLFDNIAVARGRACVDRQANEHEQVANERQVNGAKERTWGKEMRQDRKPLPASAFRDIFPRPLPTNQPTIRCPATILSPSLFSLFPPPVSFRRK